MNKLYLSRILKLAALLLPIVLFVLFAQNYLFYYADKHTERIQSFYQEEENSLDVVLLGASELYNGFSPGYAYHNYGYTSYVYAIGSNQGSLYKSELKEILSKQNPQLIVVEIGGFLDDLNDEVESEVRMRIFTESIPMSRNKINTILHHDYEDKLSCFLPFIKYHGDWQKIRQLPERINYKLSADPQPSILKGMETITITDARPVLHDPQNSTDTAELSQKAQTHLVDFLEYCRNEQLDNIVFVKYPLLYVNAAKFGYFARSNQAGEIINQYGYPYISLDKMAAEIGIDYSQDFADSDHLNIHGTRKVVDFLSRLFLEQYSLAPMEQTATNKAHWDTCRDYTLALIDYAEHCFREGIHLELHETPELLEELQKYMG